MLCRITVDLEKNFFEVAEAIFMSVLTSPAASFCAFVCPLVTSLRDWLIEFSSPKAIASLDPHGPIAIE